MANIVISSTDSTIDNAQDLKELLSPLSIDSSMFDPTAGHVSSVASKLTNADLFVIFVNDSSNPAAVQKNIKAAERIGVRSFVISPSATSLGVVGLKRDEWASLADSSIASIAAQIARRCGVVAPEVKRNWAKAVVAVLLLVGISGLWQSPKAQEIMKQAQSSLAGLIGGGDDPIDQKDDEPVGPLDDPAEFQVANLVFHDDDVPGVDDEEEQPKEPKEQTKEPLEQLPAEVDELHDEHRDEFEEQGLVEGGEHDAPGEDQEIDIEEFANEILEIAAHNAEIDTENQINAFANEVMDEGGFVGPPAFQEQAFAGQAFDQGLTGDVVERLLDYALPEGHHHHGRSHRIRHAGFNVGPGPFYNPYGISPQWAECRNRSFLHDDHGYGPGVRRGAPGAQIRIDNSNVTAFNSDVEAVRPRTEPRTTIQIDNSNTTAVNSTVAESGAARRSRPARTQIDNSNITAVNSVVEKAGGRSRSAVDNSNTTAVNSVVGNRSGRAQPVIDNSNSTAVDSIVGEYPRRTREAISRPENTPAVVHTSKMQEPAQDRIVPRVARPSTRVTRQANPVVREEPRVAQRNRKHEQQVLASRKQRSQQAPQTVLRQAARPTNRSTGWSGLQTVTRNARNRRQGDSREPQVVTQRGRKMHVPTASVSRQRRNTQATGRRQAVRPANGSVSDWRSAMEARKGQRPSVRRPANGTSVRRQGEGTRNTVRRPSQGRTKRSVRPTARPSSRQPSKVRAQRRPSRRGVQSSRGPSPRSRGVQRGHSPSRRPPKAIRKGGGGSRRAARPSRSPRRPRMSSGRSAPSRRAHGGGGRSRGGRRR
jgi:hypothetical protein